MSLVFDKSRFPILTAMEEAYPMMRREMEAIAKEDYVVWPDTGAYLGDWRLFLIVLNSYPRSLEVDFEANQRRCPGMMEWYHEHPNVFAIGFSWMEPNCHITPHVDLKPDTQLRAHLGLQIPSGARFRVGEGIHEWREGEAVVFEGLIDHEAVNGGSEPRIIVMLDFKLSRDELEYSREFMKNVDPRFLESGGGAMSVR